MVSLRQRELASYFSQDDFYHLRQIANFNFSDIPRFLLPKYSLEETFYRPVSREIYMLVMYKLFGLNALAFHLVNLSLILVNGWLGYKFIKNFTKNQAVAFLASGLYYFSSIHSVELYYLSSNQTLFSTFFGLTGLIFYQRILIKFNRLDFVLAELMFGLAILSHESAVVFIGIVGGLEIENWLTKRTSFGQIFWRLSPLMLMVGLRVIVQVVATPLPTQSVYKPNFYPGSIINSLFWLLLWCLGLPEMLVDFMTLTLKFNPNFWRFYSDYAKVVFPLVGFVVVGLFAALAVCWRRLNRKFLIIGIFLGLSVLPFCFFPEHKFSYYLSLPIVWFETLIAWVLVEFWIYPGKHSSFRRGLVGLMAFSLVIISWQTANLNSLTHWAAKRSAAAADIVTEVKQKYPVVAPGTVFYLKNDPAYPFIALEWGNSSKQAFFILSGSDAFQLIYQDPKLKVFYEDMGGVPDGVDRSSVIEYTPHFRY